MKRALLCGAAALLLLVGEGKTSAAVIGLSNVAFSNVITPILTGAGHTVVLNPNLNNPIAVDLLYLGRGQVGIGGAQLNNVRSFLADGGCVMTEFTATDMWFNGALASFAGTNNNSFFVPSGSVLGNNTVTVTDAGHQLANGLPASWLTGDPIGVFEVYTGLDAAIDTPIELLNSNPYGDIPVVGTAQVGSGFALMFFTDFADFNNPIRPEEIQLLLNAAGFQKQAIPEPATLALCGLVGLGLAGYRLRRRIVAIF